MTITSTPQSSPPQPAPAPGQRLSARTAAWLLLLAASLMAATLALALGWWFGLTVWTAPLAAALGVLAAALPLALLVARAAAQPRTVALRGAPQAAIGLQRELFMDLAGREWARARRYGAGAALLVVEVDRFARLVETRGTDATDAVLAELLLQTAPSLRGADMLTRFAESQMAVFLAPADATGALDVAERIRERAEQMEVPWQPHPMRITVSVGVAHLRPAHLNLQALVDDAGDALAAARQASGNCVRAAPVEPVALRAPDSWPKDNRARPK